MRVSTSLNITLNLGNYQSYKMEIGVHDIDPEADVRAQLQVCSPAIKLAAEWVEQELANKLESEGLIPRLRDRAIPK